MFLAQAPRLQIRVPAKDAMALLADEIREEYRTGPEKDRATQSARMESARHLVVRNESDGSPSQENRFLLGFLGLAQPARTKLRAAPAAQPPASGQAACNFMSFNSPASRVFAPVWSSNSSATVA